DLFCAENPGAEGCFDWVSGTPYGCCNSGDECKPRTVGGGTYPSVDTGFCCSTTSTQCENDDDCCPGTVCSSLDGTCHPCDGLGEANVHGCCPHLDDRGGICRPECDEE